MWTWFLLFSIEANIHSLSLSYIQIKMSRIRFLSQNLFRREISERDGIFFLFFFIINIVDKKFLKKQKFVLILINSISNQRNNHCDKSR